MTKFILSVVVSVSLMFSGMLFANDKSDVELLASDKVISSELLTESRVHISAGARVGNIIFLSGQIGTVPGTLTLAAGGIKAESRQSLENIKTTLESHGYSLNNIVKCKVLLADISEWEAFNEVWSVYFSEHHPARTAFGGHQLGFGARVQIECIAAVS